MTTPFLLTLSGSDPSAGAGLQADLKTATALNLYAFTVVTGLTSQNFDTVKEIQSLPCGFISSQIDALFAAGKTPLPNAVKIGMIPNAEAIEEVSEAIKRYSFQNIVVDPVLSPTSGPGFVASQNITSYREKILSHAALVTPNLPEAEILAGSHISSSEEMVSAAEEIIRCTGCKAMLIKGGHSPSPSIVTDILVSISEKGMKAERFIHPRIDSTNLHGTGCTLSTAIACGLAKGYALAEAVRRAIAYTSRAIAAGSDYNFGTCSGPLRHKD